VQTTLSYPLLVRTGFGIESVTIRELTQLGYDASVEAAGKVRFHGQIADIMRSNLWLRTADRISVEVAQIPASNFDELFDGIRGLPWEEYIDRDGAFPVKVRSFRSQLKSVPAIQRSAKRAIVEHLMESYAVSELSESGGTYTIEVEINSDVATLSIDTSGNALSRRGYRDSIRPSVVKETLAAAMIQLSHWNAQRPLVDPFCGAGAILIEAAMIAKNIAPGLSRGFAFESWDSVDLEAWRGLQEQAIADQLQEDPDSIIGYDENDSALRWARSAAKSAGVDTCIHFQRQAFPELQSKREYGCLITSPPIDTSREKIPDHQLNTVRQFPSVLRHLPTWSHFVLSPLRELERIWGQAANRKRKLYNGREECHYYQFHGPPPGKRVAAAEPTAAVPAFGGLDTKGHEQAELLKNRLLKTSRHLRRWPKRGIHCFRLYERDIPEIPLVIDRYHDHLHIADYERPHDRTPAQYMEWLELMTETARTTLEIPEGQVFLKHRARQSGTTQHTRVNDQSYIFPVEEGGLKFEVNLSDYVDTGLFLDHRILRSQIREEAKGKRILNLFCYTGAFSVYAAAGGAESTTSVDLSNTYLDWAGRNFQLNGISIARHDFIRSDVMEFLANLPTMPQFDLAIVDVPTFSNSKKHESIWDVQRDHVELLNRTLAVMPEGATLYFSNNFRRFKLDEPAIDCQHIREISKHTVPEDFRNKRIHQCWKLIR